MGRYFEIRYAPDQWSAPPGGVAASWTSPYGGLNVQAPANMIGPQYSPSLNNVTLRNCEIKNRPAFKSYGVPTTFGPVNAVGSFLAFASGYAVKTFAISTNALFELITSGTAWSASRGGFGSSVIGTNVVWNAFKGTLYWTGSSEVAGGGVLSSGHVSAWDGGGTTLPNIAFTGAVSPPVAGQTCFGAAFIGELANRIILANVGEVDAGGGLITQFPQRIRWSNNGFDPHDAAGVFGGNLGTAGATFDPTISSGAGFTDLLDTPDVITGLMMMGRVGYVFRTNGITEVTPTGVGTAPFNFDHLWASQKGIGNVMPWSIAQYGAIGVFISTEQIYSITPGGPSPIGGGARDAILADVVLANATPVATITPALNANFVYFTYMLFIPQAGNKTIVYVYSFEDGNWTKWTLSKGYINAQFPPTFCQIAGTTGGNSKLLLVPNANIPTTDSLWTFDPTMLSDPNDACSYFFRAENIISMRVPTVRRVWITYKDLGAVTFTVTLSGTNDNGATVTQSKTVTVGGTNAGALCTTPVDVGITAFRPQLSIACNAGAGPLNIVEVVMVGEVEETQL